MKRRSKYNFLQYFFFVGFDFLLNGIFAIVLLNSAGSLDFFCVNYPNLDEFFHIFYSFNSFETDAQNTKKKMKKNTEQGLQSSNIDDTFLFSFSLPFPRIVDVSWNIVYFCTNTNLFWYCWRYLPVPLFTCQYNNKATRIQSIQWNAQSSTIPYRQQHLWCIACVLRCTMHVGWVGGCVH